MFERHRRMTPCEVAQLFGRGVLANFSPDNQAEEIRKMAELCRDIAMAREAEHETVRDPLAPGDAAWFTAIADELDSFFSP